MIRFLNILTILAVICLGLAVLAGLIWGFVLLLPWSILIFPIGYLVAVANDIANDIALDNKLLIKEIFKKDKK